MNIKVSVLACALALVGCGEDAVENMNADAGNDSGSMNIDGGGNGDAGGNEDGGTTPDMAVVRTGIPLAELPGEVAAIFCAQRECLSDGESVLLREIFVPEGANCVERATGLIATAFLGENIAAVTAGKATYSETAALACVESLMASTTCEFIDGSCIDDLFPGALALGAACTRDYDYCVDGAVCSTPDFVSYMCPGTCVAAAGKGESCEAMPCEEPSAENTYANCEDSGAGRRCYHYTYEETAAAGDACDVQGEEVEFLTITTGCMPGLDCEGEPGARTCVASAEEPIALGQACDDEEGDRCVDGAICAGTCRAISLTSTVDAACGISGTSMLVLCDPNDGVVCDINPETLVGTCKAFGDGTLGATCTSGVDVILGEGGCNAGLYCPEVFDGSPLASECATLLENGTACESNDECESGLCNWNGEGNECAELDCTPPS